MKDKSSMHKILKDEMAHSEKKRLKTTQVYLGAVFGQFNSVQGYTPTNSTQVNSKVSQSEFCEVYKVKDENMKKLDCASFPMVCGPMFLWSGPPGATKKFLPMDQRGDLSEIIFSLWSPL